TKQFALYDLALIEKYSCLWFHMGSGFCWCAGWTAAEVLRIAAVGGGVPDAPRPVKTAPYKSKDKRAPKPSLRAGQA
ncbi:UNVERIFIED_CONTAM: hypothetical protein NY603_41940, partial [Bacteroidetes bacterium 56_B9]